MVQIDIQMPSDCYSCWVRKNMGCKIANDSGWMNNKRDNNCPLKEQEAIEPISYHRSDGTIFKYECRQCRTKIFKMDLFCRHCGQKVKWNE